MTRCAHSNSTRSDGNDAGPFARLLRPPVILQVLPSLVTGGVERGTVDVAAAVVAAGGRAVVASQGGPMVRELLRAGAEHVELPLQSKNPAVMWRNAGRLAALIEDRGVDLVHARSRAPAWSARAAARRTGRPFVTTFHGTYNAGNALKRRYNAVMASGDRVIAISHFIAGHAARLYDVPEERIRVIHRGVDTARFDPAAVSADRVAALAAEWRLPEAARVVLLPGRLTRWKGQALLIEAMGRLARPGLCCVLVGSDQGRHAYRQELERLAAARGLAEAVRIVGECRDMPAACLLSDMVVSASTDPEGFGRVMAEAGAMGRPVVAAAHGAAPEIVVEGETGLLFVPSDPDSLARAIDRVLALSADERSALAARAADRVRACFTNTAMCDKTLAVYAELLTTA